MASVSLDYESDLRNRKRGGGAYSQLPSSEAGPKLTETDGSGTALCWVAGLFAFVILVTFSAFTVSNTIRINKLSHHDDDDDDHHHHGHHAGDTHDLSFIEAEITALAESQANDKGQLLGLLHSIESDVTAHRNGDSDAFSRLTGALTSLRQRSGVTESQVAQLQAALGIIIAAQPTPKSPTPKPTSPPPTPKPTSFNMACDSATFCPSSKPANCAEWTCLRLSPDNVPRCYETRMPNCQDANLTFIRQQLMIGEATPNWQFAATDRFTTSFLDEAGPVSHLQNDDVTKNTNIKDMKCTLYRVNGTLFCATTLHKLTYETLPINPVTDLSYENFAPDQLFTVETANIYNYDNIDRKTELPNPRVESFFSDCWGFVAKSYTDDGTVETIRYSLVTSFIGLYVMRKDDTPHEVNTRHDLGIVQYIDMSREDGSFWGDVKMYDITVFNAVITEVEAIPKSGDIVTFTDGNEFDYPVRVLRTIDLGDFEFSFRVKCDFTLPADVTAPGITYVQNVRRILTGYMVKEGSNGMIAIDFLPTLVGDDAIVTKDFSLIPDAPNEFNGNVVVSTGKLAGAHNVYVNEEMGYLLWNGGGLFNSSLYAEGNLVFLLDPEHGEDANLYPVASYYFNGTASGYTHDSVIVTYSRQEQADLLGIPDSLCNDNLVLAVTSDEEVYGLQNITNLANVTVLHKLSIPNGGYYHQAWLTTDKRYYVISDEGMADELPNFGRVPVARIFWNNTAQSLQSFHVQDVHSPFPSNLHNQYTISNAIADLPAGRVSKAAFDDWIVGSQYDAGLVATSIRYKNTQDISPELPVQERFALETAKDPFIVTQIGFVDTTSQATSHDFGGSWSVYPFWEVGVRASDSHYTVSGDDSAVSARYKEGVQNTVAFDGTMDGYVRLLTANAPSRQQHGSHHVHGTDEKDDGEQTNKAPVIQDWPQAIVYVHKNDTDAIDSGFLLPFSTSSQFDLWIAQVIETVDVTYKNLDIAQSIAIGDAVHMLQSGQVVSGTVISTRSTEYIQQMNGQRIEKDFYGYEAVAEYGLNSEGEFVRPYRLGEIVVSLPCRPGQSGSPVVNDDGKLVGIIRDADPTGHTCGLINFVNGTDGATPLNLPSYENTAINFRTTGYSGFEGYFNVYVNESDHGQRPYDPTKFLAVAINPRTGQFYAGHSGTGTRYMFVDLSVSGYAANEDGYFTDVTGSGNAVSFYFMNETVYFSRGFDHTFGWRPALTYAVSIVSDGPWNANAFFAEEFTGIYQAERPARSLLRIRRAFYK